MRYGLIIRGIIGDWWSGTDAQTVCDFLNANDGKEVEIAVCSPGGYVTDGLEIYHAIKQHGKVNITIVGVTASIATVLAMAAAKVSMAKQALILIHNSSTLVSEWSSCNKERLDAIIKKLSSQRDNLETIDKLIASIYVDKCKKKEEDIAELMNEEKYITADKALELGLIDEIIDTPEMEKQSKDVSNLFNANYISQFGLPALPYHDTGSANALSGVVDGEGNPAESFLQKAVQKIQLMLHITDKTANKNENETMKKTFTMLMACLAVTDLAADGKGNVTLSPEQLQKIEDKLVTLQKDLTAANTAKEETEKQLPKLQDVIKQKDTEIENLKKSAPADADIAMGVVESLPDDKLASAMFNVVKDL